MAEHIETTRCAGQGRTLTGSVPQNWFRWANNQAKSGRFFFRYIAVLALLCLCTAEGGVADPWLDRVERNLKRINSAANYTEPAGAGSRAATEVHRACIRDNDESACAKLIWRSPELLPVRDWAVGTAHIKRGELREQQGNARGAVDDYRDALGYHQFPNLKARIKRLELRIKKQEAEQAKEQAEQRLAEAAAPPPRHPIVVVDGWAPLRSGTSDAAPTAAPAPPQGVVANDTPQSPPPTAAAEKVRALDADPVEVLATNFVPGRTMAASTAPQEPVAIELKGAKPAQEKSKNNQKRHGRPAQSDTGTDETNVITTSNLTDEATRSLDQVRERTSSNLTTAALPDHLRYSGAPASSNSTIGIAAIMVAFMMIATMIAYTLGWRLVLPSSWSIPSASERKPILSVEDLESLIKNRSEEARGRQRGAESTFKRFSQAIPIAYPSLQGSVVEEQEPPAKTANGDDGGATKPNKSDGGRSKTRRETQDPKFRASPDDGETSSDGLIDEASSDRDIANDGSPDGNDSLAKLDVSLLRRASYGAVHLLVVTEQENALNFLQEKVGPEQQSELVERCLTLSVSDPRAQGVLNPFEKFADESESLKARQKFNAAFELQTSIFEAIFGSRFVYDQRADLRNIVSLIQKMDQPDFRTLYTCLKERRSLSSFSKPLSKIDSVSTRLFFTTVFNSEEFSMRAQYMMSRLEPFLADEKFSHLCCGEAGVDPFQRSASNIRLIGLGLASSGQLDAINTVIIRSLMSVLCMKSRHPATPGSDEVAAFIHLDSAARRLIGRKQDLQFLIGEVNRSGYHLI